ncbi:T6SS effector amidase Tae4 family protein [Flavobacterium hercynium]|uniref:Type VI secretion system (T6SS), amidase effector protein 4 n=1 Tax=Flavobacterium hercynium TaxID=387094 RepID=A0A226GV23_9FLAO|nr:T6SS effector amidase Tae4 family protein [Flavobacterium hercynium]OXA85892.1 hypothetical protein B0A66_18715 [Flavobacterium hercynium]SMP33733.1 Type VI secretion system (T6SS), amidase effector protein 4 [Flavobacterium hercynium]
MDFEKIIPVELMQVVLVPESNGVQFKTVTTGRPSWKDVYEGYPKNATNTDDLPATTIFTDLLGSNYDKAIFGNACATRVSLGLLNGKMVVKTAFKITNKKHAFYNKGFQTSASGLQTWLSKKDVWGEADVIVKGPSDISTVASKINDKTIKNGVYIILGGFGGGISGHATLWIGANKNVIGGHNYVDYGGTVYFWELK